MTINDLHPATIAEAQALPGAMLHWLPENDAYAADDAGDPIVWLVTADTYAIGDTDLDNETVIVGIFARLHDAVTEVMRRVLTEGSSMGGLHTHNPQFTQTVVRGWTR